MGFSAAGYDDVWILHGCDGAGIQTDCAGDIMYLEHFDSKSPVAEQDCPVGNYGQDHTQCPTFYHQGLQESLPGYSCGWWRGYNSPVGIEEANGDGIGALGPKENDGDTQTGDYSSSLLDALRNCPDCAGGTALEHPYAGTDALAYFTGASWPWICTWGGDGDMPYTGSTANCYCDNEPWNGRQPKGGFLGAKPEYPRTAMFTYCVLFADDGTGIKLVCDFITMEGAGATANRGVELFPTDFEGGVTCSSKRTYLGRSPWRRRAHLCLHLPAMFVKILPAGVPVLQLPALAPTQQQCTEFGATAEAESFVPTQTSHAKLSERVLLAQK